MTISLEPDETQVISDIQFTQLVPIMAMVEITAPLIFTANLADSRLQNSSHNLTLILASIWQANIRS